MDLQVPVHGIYRLPELLEQQEDGGFGLDPLLSLLRVLGRELLVSNYPSCPGHRAGGAQLVLEHRISAVEVRGTMRRIFRTQYNYYMLHAMSRMRRNSTPSSVWLKSDSTAGFSLMCSWTNNTGGDSYVHSWSWSTGHPLSRHRR